MNKYYLLPGILLSSHAVAQSPPAPATLPAGGRVIAGEAAVSYTDSTLSIQQSSDRAAIDWQSFDVGSRATVEFLQPGASSVALNRVSGANASQIFGRISANGQVFLSNPNGVYFAPGASVNVGSLVATTHRISVEDFMEGRVKFERSGATGSVINEGEIFAALGGYIALLAPEVRNHGLILANLGTVALAAGEAFELQFGSNNTLANLRVTPSTIHALVENRSAVLAPGGLIILSARAVDRIQGGVIRHSGTLEATGLAQRGGRIVLEGDDLTLAAGSRIDASGQTGGGVVLAGGDWQGSGDLHQALRVSMESGASIDVSAIESGDGGTAVLWSDVQAAGGSTAAHGEILARGGAAGGNGGRIETSGHDVDVAGARVSAAAPLGAGGTWLIDPYSYAIGAPAAATISSALSSGTSVTVTTTSNNPGFGSSGNASDSGAIVVSNAITKSGGNDATLTLQAHRDVHVNAPISSSAGRLNLVLWSDYANENVAGVAIRSPINTNGGHVWVGGSATSGGSSVWNGLTVGNGPSVGSPSGNHNALDFSADITTAGGAILMWAGEGVTGVETGPGIGLNGARTIDAGSGDVTLLTNRIFNWQNGGALAINTTGHLTLAPALGSAYDAAFDWTGTSTAGNFRLNNTLSANAVTINGIASLGGLSIGRYAGMSSGGTPLVLGNSANVDVNSPISIAGPVAMHGGTVNVLQNISAAGDITLESSSGDVVLEGAIINTAAAATALNIEAARHIRVGTNASITATTAAMNSQLWADTNADADGIVFFTSSGIDTHGGSLTFGRNGQMASIGGSNVRVGGDVFFQRGSTQTLSTGGGALNVYGETIVANTAGLAIHTSNGAASFHGLLNSGNAYSFVDRTGSAGSGTWDAARTDARNGTAGGSALGDSYLVTITSRLENSIAGVAANYRGSWIGAYRPNTNSYNWAWADGPEAGQTFFTQAPGGGAAGAGFYANFGSGEPNGALNATRASTESVGQFFGSAGLWNDLPHTTAYSATQSQQYAVLGFVRETNIAASPVTINAGTGAVTVQGGVGVSKALASLQVTSSATTVTGSGLVTTGAQSYSSGLAADAGSGNLLLQASSITAGGAVTASGAAIVLDADLTSSSHITLTGNSVSFAGPTTIDTSGALTVQPLGISFSSALTWPLANLSLAPGLTGLTLGKPGNTANITVASTQSIAGPISIYGGNITLDAGLEAGGDTITLQGSGNVTDGTSGYVSALNLRLLGGNVTLDNAGNGVGYLAASGVGNLTFIDNDTLVLATVGGTSGISATGVVNIGTLAGDLSLLDDVRTTNTSSTALTLNADIDATAGTTGGGSLFVFNDAAVSVGAGGRGRLFTGNTVDTGLNVLVGSGSNRFRYNSDELATNYSLALGSGLYAIYREQPTVGLRISDQSMVYGGPLPAWMYTLANAFNGDTFAQAFTGSPVVSVGGATSTAGHYIAGAHALTGNTGSAASQLGYAVSPTLAAGELTVSPRTLTVTYSGNNRIYAGDNSATVNDSDNRLADDVFTIAESAAFADANAGVGRTINVSGIALSGTDAGNYSVATTTSTTADITPRTLTLSATRAYDGTTALGAGTVTFGNLIGNQALGFTGAIASNAHVATGGKHVSTITLLDGANGGLASNYQLPALDAVHAPVSITPAILAPAVTNSGVTRAYDGTMGAPTGFVPTWNYIGLVAGDTAASLSSAGAAYDSKDVATAASLTVAALGIDGITGSNGSASTDYVLDSTSKSVAASVTARAVTVTGLAADDKVYDGGSAATLSNAGSVATGVGTETLHLSNAGAAFSDANAGAGKTVTASGYALADGDHGGLASNYALTSTTAATTANIHKAVLTVTANDDAKFVARPDASGYAGLSYNGFVFGETAAVLGGAASVIRNNSGTNVAGAYADVLAPDVSGLSAMNYSFALQNGDYTIVPSSQLLVRVASSTTGYGTQPGYTIGSAEYLDADANVIALTGITDHGNGRFTVSDGAGGAASFTVAPADAARSGAGFLRAGSHQLDAINVTTVNAQNFGNQLTLTGNREVTRRGISAAAVDGVSKVYDGTTAMVDVQIGLTGVESADALAITGNGEFSSRNAGTGLDYTVVDLALGGADAANYFLTAGTSFSGRNGSITPRTLVVSYAGTGKVYDGNAVAVVTVTDNRIAGDALAIHAAATFADKNVGTGKVVTIGDVTLSGADAGNYRVSGGGSTTATITRLDSVTWTGGASGNWFDPANWAGGAVPDLANVANVILPAGVNVSFDTTGAVSPAQAGPVQLLSLGTAGNLTQHNGELAVGAGGLQLEGYTQNGGLLDTDGDFTVTGHFSQGPEGAVRVGGNASITDLSGGTSVGNLSAGGNLSVTTTGGDITQAAGALIHVIGNTMLQAPDHHVLLNSGNTFGGALTEVDASPTAAMPPVPPPAPPAFALPTPRSAPQAANMGLMNVSVALVTAPRNQLPGLVAVHVPHGMTSTGFTFVLPEELTHGMPAGTRSTATLEDGSRLPAWLTYDAKNQRFFATQIPASALPIRIAVKIGARQVTVVVSVAASY